jgi:hypothetical protein
MLERIAPIRELLDEYRRAKLFDEAAAAAALASTYEPRYRAHRTEFEALKQAVLECPDCTEAIRSHSWPTWPSSPTGASADG